ncbi:PIG-L deacetylase family protein [Benzoatithermus flavus]|uniref:PIG-L deacetylase family protein n=1 Tax=Benzoatithermus flavus TaxID=3108223 RepID=A0ABU8XVQ9_9PROT
MRALTLAGSGGRLRILCLGAHADDIEIGCGATILDLIARGVRLEVDWCVLSATPVRAEEARASAMAFLEGAVEARIEVQGFRDGHFPWQGSAIKEWFEILKARPRPDLVLTHTRDDRHQDHREVCNLTWNTFRDHLILEYEIPKWDGDLGRPGLYVPVSEEAVERKVELLHRHFPTQATKPWFDRDTFRGLARLRGLECASPTRFAEAFFAPKLALDLAAR